ncbi:LysR family transcriptional regulator [Acetobacter nitrogenifigens DSM 23921 = NBRC 105050]|uniref:Transcriptional regulator n=1 Tax=Acetobacter nitrogenifigens DSM 23921 = NBRC 105050 TaxID=1120919 RepID=A0A511XBG7_9PROT|nr:LysR family transcriptional regulator [Acetobacter nitrogenifigens]GBQ93128.1 LysR family transcriptional regulator [Acetobacter nitrogenifigens DSM 23921 = NBRC 105050]GEN60225.1 transcriptional regulator [Acetobacter nitrogenifigens DSM 23921 = NBRC 105050]
MLDRVTGMQTFVRVVADGSFAAAARSLGMSQTMVTKHIAALETRLGVALFQRSTRRLSLTEAGRRFLDGCQRILPALDDVEQAVAVDAQEPRGTLRLNAPVSFAIRYVAPLLSGFSERYPLVTVDLGLDDRTVDLIEDGWDLALRIRRMAPSSLRARKLASIRMVVCAAPSYLARHGTPATVADLQRHACLGYTLSDAVGTTRWSFGDKGERTAPIRCPLVANNGDALREAAIVGQGIIYQPTFIVADALRSGALVTLAFDAPLLEASQLHAVYAPTPTVSLKVRAMIDYLAEQYGAERYGGVPPWEEGLPPPLAAAATV